jgi:hypothetical protein
MMIRNFCFVFLTLALISCNKSGTECSNTVEAETSGDASSCTVSEAPVEAPSEGSDSPLTPAPLPSALPNEAYTFETNINFINTTVTQEEKFNKALEVIKNVIATEEFRTRVINHTYSGIKTFVDNGGFTNSQIYQMILEGAETLRPLKNNTMDMGVETYYASTTTIGYTYPNSTQIWVNTKYFNTNTVAQVASNLMHEWLHKLGFKHATYYSTSRDYSVPYAIGRMIGSIGREFQ